VKVNPDPSNANRFRWGGMYWDAHTQTYYTAHRHYNPRTGRWLSEDPWWHNGTGVTSFRGMIFVTFGIPIVIGNEVFMKEMHRPNGELQNE